MTRGGKGFYNRLFDLLIRPPRTRPLRRIRTFRRAIAAALVALALGRLGPLGAVLRRPRGSSVAVAFADQRVPVAFVGQRVRRGDGRIARVEGCMIQTGTTNYNPAANVLSGCIFTMLGCMNPTASNYVSAAYFL